MNIHFTVGQETDFLESGVVDRVRGMGDEESLGGGGGGGEEKKNARQLKQRSAPN